MSEPSLPAAGWYPDPEDPAGMRYWDGSQWTEQRAPGANVAPGAMAQAGPAAARPNVTVVGQTTNGMAVASLVLGILWLYWVGSILALVFGYVAKGQIDASGGTQGGRGLAVAGIVLGWVGVGVLAVLLVVLAVGSASS